MPTLRIRLLRIPNAMVLEHPDEFVREAVDAIRASIEEARQCPLTRLAAAGESAAGEPPSPLGEGKVIYCAPVGAP